MTGKRSRKGTKNWRKNIDLTAVQDSIDETQTEQRLGGIINQKSDQDLFTVDARRDSSLVPFDQPKRMRIDEILKPNSSFSLPTSKFLSKKGNSAEKIKPTWGKSVGTEVTKLGAVDPWENPVGATKKKGQNSIAAFKLPLPGQSYRPNEQDHQECLHKAAEIVIAVEKQEQLDQPKDVSHLKFNATTDEMVIKANIQFINSDLPANKQYNSINEAGLESFGQEQPNSTESEITIPVKRKLEDEEEDSIANQPRPILKASQRKKLRLDREEAEKQQQQIQLAKDIQNISTIMTEITERKHKSKVPNSKPSPVGRYSTIPVKLPEEIPSTLRTLSVEGDLLTESFAAFQQKAMIKAPSKRTNIIHVKRNRRRIR